MGNMFALQGFLPEEHIVIGNSSALKMPKQENYLFQTTISDQNREYLIKTTSENRMRMLSKVLFSISKINFLIF